MGVIYFLANNLTNYYPVPPVAPDITAYDEEDGDFLINLTGIARIKTKNATKYLAVIHFRGGFQFSQRI